MLILSPIFLNIYHNRLSMLLLLWSHLICALASHLWIKMSMYLFSKCQASLYIIMYILMSVSPREAVGYQKISFTALKKKKKVQRCHWLFPKQQPQKCCEWSRLQSFQTGFYQVTDAATEKHLHLHWCSVWPKNKPKNKNPTKRYILLQHANQIPAAKFKGLNIKMNLLSWW